MLVIKRIESGRKDSVKLYSLRQSLLTLPQHCGLLQFNDVYIYDDSVYAVSSDVMNYGNILHFLRKQRLPCLTEREASDGVLVIANALRVLHQAGHVHGRIHPGSVLMDKRERSGCTIKLQGLHGCVKKSESDIRKCPQKSLFFPPEI